MAHCSETEPHHQIQFSVITPFYGVEGVLCFCKKIQSAYFEPQRSGYIQFPTYFVLNESFEISFDIKSWIYNILYIALYCIIFDSWKNWRIQEFNIKVYFVGVLWHIDTFGLINAKSYIYIYIYIYIHIYIYVNKYIYKYIFDLYIYSILLYNSSVLDSEHSP